MPAFVPGEQLCRRFYVEQVRPVLDARFPGLPHGAALLGRGSEVLGFDDEMSTDHNWEPRVLVFLREDDHIAHGDALDATLRERLPSRFEGRPTEHSVSTVSGWFLSFLGVDVGRDLGVLDWLSVSEPHLRMATAGAVFHDDVGLQAARDRLGYYPRDVWLYLLAAGWWRVHPEANLIGRVGFVGDELGSALLASRLVHDLMHLCFLMERQYAPYSKWFGTAFARLPCGPELAPVLWRVLRAETWQEREGALLSAYERVAARHDALGITAPVATAVEQMWDRPFRVLWGDFPGALHEQIADPAVRRVATRWPVGGVDQVRDVLPGPDARRLLQNVLD